jgi:ADP-heptose:LPS heptosyltransferase
VPGVSLVITDGEPLPEFDMHCPLLSLPLVFETELATIPANVPYVRPHQERIDKWRDRLPNDGRLRVGIVWAGNGAHLNDHNRSIPLPQFATLLSVPNIAFVSVQKDTTAAQAELLEQHGVLQLGSEFSDFADTAAVVAMLDLLIAVDTSVAHLAGAMGKAVALLLPFSPDWRWLLGRSDSPWYPTMRLFRQSTIADWDTPLTRLRDELAELAARRATAS